MEKQLIFLCLFGLFNFLNAEITVSEFKLPKTPVLNNRVPFTEFVVESNKIATGKIKEKLDDASSSAADNLGEEVEHFKDGLNPTEDPLGNDTHAGDATTLNPNHEAETDTFPATPKKPGEDVVLVYPENTTSTQNPVVPSTSTENSAPPPSTEGPILTSTNRSTETSPSSDEFVPPSMDDFEPPSIDSSAPLTENGFPFPFPVPLFPGKPVDNRLSYFLTDIVPGKLMI